MLSRLKGGFIVLTAACLAASSECAWSNVTMPAIFGDHMVLQEGMNLPVWGSAAPGEAVTVSFGGHIAHTKADAQGKWIAALDRLPLNHVPGELRVEGLNKLVFADVLVGDVWLCSGQSNMEFGIDMENNAADMIAKADYPEIRLFLMDHQVGLKAQTDCHGQWVICTPENLRAGGIVKDGKNIGFSAVAYFFGRELYQAKHVPIGLLQAAWGGTPAQAWVSPEAMAQVPALKAYVEIINKALTKSPEELRREYDTDILPKWQQAYDAWQKQYGATYPAELKKWKDALGQLKPGETPPGKPAAPPAKPIFVGEQGGFPGVLFNGMINPVIPFGLKGVIWYQGESNAGEKSAGEYQVLFPTLISDWRRRWNQGDFPFLFVQLAGFRSGLFFPRVRYAQLETLSLPNTGMALATDIGDPANIHPQDKVDVGRRLALVARHVAYGEDLVFSGPLYESAKVEGNKIRVSFKYTGGGLAIGSQPPDALPQAPEPQDHIVGFMIAGGDGKFLPAKAVIDGGTVLVSNEQVEDPKSVRYGWDPFPEMNLYNKEGLPASPFSSETDLK